MRTEERWQQVIQPKIIKRLFPPRLAEDLLKLNLEPVADFTSRYIYGTEKRTGKTVYACQMLLGFEKKAYFDCALVSTKFLSVVDFINELKDSFDTPGVSEIDILYKYRDIDVLVLDDLGTDKMSDWLYHVIYSLINYRYEYLKKTIITSNFPIEELEEAWHDDRITSRISRICEITLKEKY